MRKCGIFFVILTQSVINTPENRVVIRKMRQYKSGEAVQMFSMAFLET